MTTESLCATCPHPEHTGLCFVLIDPPEVGQVRCAYNGRPKRNEDQINEMS